MKKIVLVTGCSRGLGRLLAEFLCDRGFIVYAGIRKEEDFPVLCDAWKESKLDIKAVKLDVTSDEDCRKAVGQVLKDAGRLDVLVNCAALVLAGPGENYSAGEFLNLLNVNSVGPFRLIKEAIIPMRTQRGGSIINVTSLNGRVSLPGFSLYSASKHALEALGLALHYELRKSGIYLTNIAPGAIGSQKDHTGNLDHVPVRERFFLMRKLLPMLSPNEVVANVMEVINDSTPPAQVIIGRDAKITSFLYRCLPQVIWDKLIMFLYG